MRILQIQGLVAGGGAEVHTLILSRGLIERGHEVFLAAPETDDPLMEEYRAAGCHIHSLPSRASWFRLFDFPSAIQIANLIRRESIDVVHTHLWNADAIGWMATRMTGTPIVATLHGPTMPIHLERRWHHRAHHWLYAKMLRGMEGLIAISKFMRDFTTEDLGIPESEMTVIHNCSDVDAYSPKIDVAEMRDEMGVPQDARVVIIVGELTGRKGILEFIEIASLVRDRSPQAHFVLVGRGPLEEPAQTEAERLGVSDRVHFLGWRADIPELLAASDLLAVCSVKEGFGRTITEAMSTSLPVVSFDSGAPREIILDGETGFLIDGRDTRKFADRLVELLTDDAARIKMGEAGLARARAEFDVPVFVDRTRKVLADVVEQRRD